MAVKISNTQYKENDWFVKTQATNRFEKCIGGWVVVQGLGWRPFIWADRQPVPSKWIPMTAAKKADWMGAVGVGKRLSVVASGTDEIYSTTNMGVTWNVSYLPSSGSWQRMTHGNGMYVVVAAGTNKAAWSRDGVNWNASTLPHDGGWHKPAFNGRMFVTIQYDSYTTKDTENIATSTTGMSWFNRKLPLLRQWTDVAAGDGKFVIVAANSRDALVSTDGTNWTMTLLPMFANWLSVAYYGGQFIAINTPVGGESDTYAVYENNKWTLRSFPIKGSWSRINCVNGLWVVLGLQSNKSLLSNDGETWKSVDLPHSGLWSELAVVDNRIVAICHNSNTFAYLEYGD